MTLHPVPAPRLTLRVLGAPRLEHLGQPVRFARRKTLALLIYLAVTRQPHSREVLLGLLWPERDQAHAAANLRHSLWEISQVLGVDWARLERDSVALDPDLKCWTDVGEFRRPLASAHATQLESADLAELTKTVELYQDDFLAGFMVRDAPAFDEWRFFQAEELRQRLALALRTLSRRRGERGEFETALDLARRWLALDPLNEAAHRQLMTLYERAGHTAAALRQYQDCVRGLQAELATAPQPETTRLYEQIRQGRAVDSTAGLPEAAPTPHNLPPQLSPLIGRQTELAELAALLARPECRLVTITGPGGVGKTRLALQVAEGQLPAFPQGVYVVSLAPLTSPEFLASAIAEALGFRFFSAAGLREGEQPGQTQQLANFLSNRHILLVLDNFEHLIVAVDLLADLLRAAPRLKIVVTSIERLNLREEWTLALLGLPVVDTPAALALSHATQLFVQAARKVQVGFEPSEADRSAIHRIGQLVEGLPLCLELAAAWITTLTCAEIAKEIERNLDFLTSTLRNTPGRHRSLRAVFDYAWRLLAEPDQAAFQQLAAFNGGFSREAALAVAGADLPQLARLANKSLLYRSVEGRYELHRTLRRYAAEKLAATAREEASTLARHAAYYANFLRARQAALRGHGQKQATEQIGQELENILAGWRWALDHASGDLHPYLDGLFWFFEIRGRFQDAEEIFRQAGEAWQRRGQQEADAQIILGKLLAWHGWFCNRMGRIDQAHRRLRQSVTVLRGLGPAAQPTLVLVNTLSLFADAVADPAEAEQMAAESLAHSRQRNEPSGIALLLPYYRRRALERGDLDGTKRLHLEALQIHQDVGDDWGVASTLNALGELHHYSGEFAEAERHHRASLEIARDLNDRWVIAMCLDYLGYLAREMGRFAEARTQHEASLALSREIGDQLGVAGSLDNLGLVAMDTGQPAEALDLFQQALALRRDAGQMGAIAFSLEHLAAAWLALGNLPEAEQCAQESVALFKQTPGWALTARATNRLGDLRRAQGNLPEAEAHYRQALRSAMQNHSVLVMLESLAGLAAAYAARKGTTDSPTKVRAVELAAFVSQHPAADYTTRTAAARLLEQLPAANSLVLTGAPRTLVQVVADALVEV